MPFCEKDPRDFWFLTDTPSVCGSALGKNRGLAMWSLGSGRRGQRNSGELQRRGRPGTGVWWFRGSLGSILTRGWGGGGAGGLVRQQRPLPATVRSAQARWRLGGKRERVSGYSRCKGRWRAPWSGNAAGRTPGLPRRPLMAGRRRSTGSWGSPTREE
jgi:hypothetical protein